MVCKKTMEGSRIVLFNKTLRIFLKNFLLRLVLFEDYKSGERSKEIHMHIEKEKILVILKIIHVGA